MAKTLDERLEDLYNRRDYVGQQFNSADVKTLVEGIRDAREKGGTPIKGATATELQPDETPTAEMTSDGTLVLGIPKGQKGDDGKQGDPGEQGKSAYQVWLDDNGWSAEQHPVSEYLNSLKAHVSRFIPIATEAGATSLEVGDTYAFSNVPNPTDGAMLLMPNGDTTTPKTLMFSVTSNGDTPETFTYTYVGELSISTEGFLSTDKIVQNLNTGGADKVPSAAAVKEMNSRLYGSDEEVVGESISISSAMTGIFIEQETNAWFGGTGVGVRKSKRITIPDGASILRFTVQTGYSRKALYTFTKKGMPASNLSFDQLVSDGYLCNDVASYTDILNDNYASGDEVELQVPVGAKYLYFVSTDSSGNQHPVPLTATPVQITHVSGDIDNLKEQCAGVKDLVEVVDKVEVKTEGIEYSETPMTYTLADGYINGDTGAETETTSGNKIVTVVVGSAKKIRFLGYQLTNYTSLSGYCFVDSDDVPLLSSKYVVNLDTETNGKTREYAVTVPEGAVALKCTVRGSEMEDFYANKVVGNTIGESISEAVNPVVSVVEELKKVNEIILTYGTDTLAYGILKEDNSVLSNDSVRHLDTPIAVQPGDVVQAYAYYTQNGNEVKYTSPDIQSVCCFKDGVNVRYGYRTITPQNVGTSTRVEYYTVPEGVNAVKLSLAAVGGYNSRKIIVWRSATAKYAKVSNNDNYDQRLTVAAMEAGVEYALPYADVWSNRCIAFSAKVTPDAESGIGTLTIGNKTGGSAVAIFGSSATSIVITDTEITITGGVNGSETFTHGLTINNDIQFIAETDRSYTQLVKVVLRSNGEEYLVNSFSHKFGQVGGERFVSASIGGVFSSVSLCNTIKDLLAPVWVFGDSYLSNNGSSRWVYWAEENNVKSFMISSFAGAKSKDQIKSFRNLIAIHRPKVLCWFLGMNDADSTGSTQSATPNADWLECAKEVIDTCDKYGVVVVLATIPSVKESGATAIWSNKAKNNWVKASGKRYFDEEAAVGATEDGVWISGFKESDGVHPSIKGAKALFTRLLADVPEIMFKN